MSASTDAPRGPSAQRSEPPACARTRAARRFEGSNPSAQQGGAPPKGRIAPEPRRGHTWLSSPGRRHDGAEKEATVMTHHQDIGEWQGKELVDCNGERIGK